MLKTGQVFRVESAHSSDREAAVQRRLQQSEVTAVLLTEICKPASAWNDAEERSFSVKPLLTGYARHRIGPLRDLAVFLRGTI